MKKIGDLFQGQVPPNQTPSTETNEKAAIKGDAARHPQQPQSIDPAEMDALRAATAAKKAELDAEVAKAKATEPEPTQANANNNDEPDADAVRRWYKDYQRRHRNYVAQTKEELEARMAAMAQKSSEQNQPPPGPVPVQTVVQLPLWPDAVRGAPNATVRSALFGVIRRGRREYVEGQKISISTVEGISILYTGPRLDQNDLDVWLQCLHLAREQALGTQIYFSAYSFLKGIDRTPKGKHNHEWLQGAFRRLMGAVVEIKIGKRAYAGQLIKDWYRDEETGENVLILNPKLIDLFADDGWTAVDWLQRMALRGHQLAQWLHAFYSTHADPYPMKVDTLRRLCGSGNEKLFHFREKLREALEAMAKATGWDWWIDEDDLVHIEKTPTPSQQRHLIRRRGRPKKPKC
jgi:hypothetical protein